MALVSFSDLLWKTNDLSKTQQHIKRLSEELSISEVFAKILVGRDLVDPTKAFRFLNPTPADLHDPFLMKDMDRAVERVRAALMGREKVVIYGDYDVDGTSATVLLYRYLKRLGARAHYFIPQRMKDGYGLTEASVRELARGGARLVITVDNGSTAVPEARLMAAMGIDLIVTDHHQLGAERPDCYALVNPQRPDCPYPFKGLSGTGVAYKLLSALESHLDATGYWRVSGCMRPALERDLDLVALATVSDRSPLVDENRYMVKEGLRLLNEGHRVGLQTLARESGIRGPLTPNTISFKLAPKINAAGRLSDPRTGVRLLLSTSIVEARQFARELIEVNTERQAIERQTLKAALVLAAEQLDRKVIFLVNESWHPGVMGSVASKVAGQFHRPVLALTHSKNRLVGSVRSAGTFDVCSALQNCADFLDKFGGHKAAAGLSLLSNNLQDFQARFQELVEVGEGLEGAGGGDPSVTIEAWVAPEDLDDQFADDLSKMEPFGMQNPEPVLGIQNAAPRSITTFGNKHLKFNLGLRTTEVEVFAWDHSDWLQRLGGVFDLVFSPQLHAGGRGMRLQFKAIDLKPTKPAAGAPAASAAPGALAAAPGAQAQADRGAGGAP